MNNVLKKLRQIKHQCGEHRECNNCVFFKNFCSIIMASKLLHGRPEHWDLDEVERIMNGDS